MRHVTADVPLKIGGTGPDGDRIRELAGRDHRVEFLGSLSDAQLVEVYADALAVPVVPRNEELGLVTLEAMRSGKPVITSRDSRRPHRARRARLDRSRRLTRRPRRSPRQSTGSRLTRAWRNVSEKPAGGVLSRSLGTGP